MASRQQPSFKCSLLAGGLAGTAVDISLFPLDTIKTRMQSPAGFRGAGGFVGVYRGLGSAAAGSAPTAALFFATYEGVKGCVASQVRHTCYPPPCAVHTSWLPAPQIGRWAYPGSARFR
jgi:solute carrier family 25 S-adenosylmethionine transporter 26